MKHHWEIGNQFCINEVPGGNKWPHPKGSYFYIGLYGKNLLMNHRPEYIDI